jgi:hypothetical protein
MVAGLVRSSATGSTGCTQSMIAQTSWDTVRLNHPKTRRMDLSMITCREARMSPDFAVDTDALAARCAAGLREWSDPARVQRVARKPR